MWVNEHGGDRFTNQCRTDQETETRTDSEHITSGGRGMIQKFWLILILILFIDLDFTMIVYGNRIMSIIALIVLLLGVAVAISYVIARV